MFSFTSLATMEAEKCVIMMALSVDMYSCSYEERKKDHRQYQITECGVVGCCQVFSQKPYNILSRAIH